MDEYVKYGRFYPTLFGMLIPFLLTFFMFGDKLENILSIINKFTSYVGVFVMSFALYGCIGYFLREISRDISKLLFQFPLFKEDETEMPTTEMLLWKNEKISDDYHNSIADKVYKQFHIHLLTPEEERGDLNKAKRLIVDAVGQMRDATRHDKMLLQYNYGFGFCRNYMGASCISLLIIVILMIISCYLDLQPVCWFVIALIVQILLATGAFLMLKLRARDYAKQLLRSFCSLGKVN